MATASSLENELTCSICLDLYTDPIVLPCMHSFCKHCLYEISKPSTAASAEAEAVCTQEEKRVAESQEGKVIDCPECRYVAVLDDKGVEGLPKNFTLANIVEKYSKSEDKKENEVPCDACEGNNPKNAVKSCLQCCISYCEVCLNQFHPSRGKFLHHKLEKPTVNLELSKVEPKPIPSENQIQIKKESQEMKYCTSCKETFEYSEEKMASHKYHFVEDLQRAKSSTVSTIGTKVLKLEKEKREVSRKIQDAKTAIGNAKEDKKRKVSEVKITLNKLRAMLDDLEQEITQPIESEAASKMDERELQMEAGEKYIEGVTRVLATAKEGMNQNLAEMSMKEFADIENELSTVLLRKASVDDKKIELPRDVSLDIRSVEEAIRQLKLPKKERKNKVKVIRCETFPGYNHKNPEIKLIWQAQQKASYDVKMIYQGFCKQTIVYEEIPREELCISSVFPDRTYQVSVCVHGDPESESQPVKVTTLKAVNCPSFIFDAESPSDETFVSVDGKQMMTKKMSKENVPGFNNLLGTIGTMSLSAGHMYWEVILSFSIPKHFSNGSFAFDVGICSSSVVDRIQPLYKNFQSYTFCAVKRGKRRIQREFNKTGKMLSEEYDLGMDWDQKMNLHVGFLLNMETQTFVIINVEDNSVFFDFEIRTPAEYVPAFSYEDESSCIEMRLLTGNEITSIPPCIIPMIDI